MNHFFSQFSSLDEAWDVLNDSFDAKMVQKVGN